MNETLPGEYFVERGHRVLDSGGEARLRICNGPGVDGRRYTVIAIPARIRGIKPLT